jgi:membrane AbrB-like protein
MEKWADTIRALIISIAGGIICYFLRVPLPWMLGPLFAMVLARIFKVPVLPLKGGRQAGQLVIGCALGQYFTPDVGSYVVSNLWLIFGCALAAVVNGYLGSIVLSRISGVDATTTFFSSLPGGAPEMVVLADRFDAKPDCVAIAHSIRVLLVVVIVPFAITWSGASGTDFYEPSVKILNVPMLMALLTAAAFVSLILQWRNIPNAWMFGSLFLSTALTLTQVRTSAVPPLFITGGQIMIGCALGSKFSPDFVRRAPKFVKGVVISVLAALAMSLILAVCVSYLGGVPFASAVLATAPGGIAEMCITAKLLHLGVPLVTAYHLTRLVFVLLVASAAFRFATWASQRLRDSRKIDYPLKTEVLLEREDND